MQKKKNRVSAVWKRLFAIPVLYYRYKKRYNKVLRRTGSKYEPKTGDLDRLEKAHLLRDHLHSAYVEWRLWIIIPILIIVVGAMLLKVKKTIITAELYVTEVQLKNINNYLYEAVDSISASRFRIFNCGGCETEYKKGHEAYDIHAMPHKFLSMTQLELPNGVNLIAGQPYTGANNIIITGKADNANPVIKLNYDTALFVSGGEAVISTEGLSVFSGLLEEDKDTRFRLNGIEQLALNSIFSEEVLFMPTDTRSDSLQSTIIGGMIRLYDTENDTVTIHSGDILACRFTSKARVNLSSSPHGLKVTISGEVNKLLLTPGIPGAEEINLKPQYYQTLYRKESLLWGIILILAPILLASYITPRKK